MKVRPTGNWPIARVLCRHSLYRFLPLVLAIGFPGPILATPFLSSDAYLISGPQPTEFLVSIDGVAGEVISPAVHLKEISTVTITAYSASTTYKVTIGGFDVTQVGTGGTTSTTAAALAGVLNSSVDANFTPITWSASGAVITGTADVAGVPFVPTSSVTGGSGTIDPFVEVADSASVYLLYDLGSIATSVGTRTATVKAQNATSTSDPTSKTFDVGVSAPNILIVPSAP